MTIEEKKPEAPASATVNVVAGKRYDDPDTQTEETNKVETKESETEPKEKVPEKKDESKDKRRTRAAILAKAKRLKKEELKKFAELLGLEEYDEEKIVEVLKGLKAKKDKEEVSGDSDEEPEEKDPPKKEDKEARLMSEERARLAAENKKLQVEIARAKKSALAKEKELEDFKSEQALREIMLGFNFRSEAVDFGMHLLRKHIASLPPEQKVGEEEAKKFFEDLRKDSKNFHLFTEETVKAGPRSDDRGTKPTPVQKADDVDDVRKLDAQAFRDRTQKTYGWAPGRSF